MNQQSSITTPLLLAELSASQRRKRRMRHRIIEVATALYDQNGGLNGGFEKTTVEAIAELADISVRTFFRYFDSKADVIFIDSNRALEALREELDMHLQEESSLEAVVSAALSHVRRFAGAPINRARVQWALQAPQFQDRLALLRSQQRQLVVQALEQGTKNRRNVPDVSQVLASIIMGASEYAIESWAQESTVDAEEVMLAFLENMAPVANALAAAGKGRRRSRLADKAKAPGPSKSVGKRRSPPG